MSVQPRKRQLMPPGEQRKAEIINPTNQHAKQRNPGEKEGSPLSVLEVNSPQKLVPWSEGHPLHNTKAVPQLPSKSRWSSFTHYWWKPHNKIISLRIWSQAMLCFFVGFYSQKLLWKLLTHLITRILFKVSSHKLMDDLGRLLLLFVIDINKWLIEQQLGDT